MMNLSGGRSAAPQPRRTIIAAPQAVTSTNVPQLSTVAARGAGCNLPGRTIFRAPTAQVQSTTSSTPVAFASGPTVPAPVRSGGDGDDEFRRTASRLVSDENQRRECIAIEEASCRSCFGTCLDHCKEFTSRYLSAEEGLRQKVRRLERTVAQRGRPMSRLPLSLSSAAPPVDNLCTQSCHQRAGHNVPFEIFEQCMSAIYADGNAKQLSLATSPSNQAVQSTIDALTAIAWCVPQCSDQVYAWFTAKNVAAPSECATPPPFQFPSAIIADVARRLVVQDCSVRMLSVLCACCEVIYPIIARCSSAGATTKMQRCPSKQLILQLALSLQCPACVSLLKVCAVNDHAGQPQWVEQHVWELIRIQTDRMQRTNLGGDMMPAVTTAGRIGSSSSAMDTLVDTSTCLVLALRSLVVEESEWRATLQQNLNSSLSKSILFLCQMACTVVRVKPLPVRLLTACLAFVADLICEVSHRSTVSVVETDLCVLRALLEDDLLVKELESLPCSEYGIDIISLKQMLSGAISPGLPK